MDRTFSRSMPTTSNRCAPCKICSRSNDVGRMVSMAVLKLVALAL